MKSETGVSQTQTLSKTHFEYVLGEPENKIRKTKIVCTIGYILSSQRNR